VPWKIIKNHPECKSGYAVVKESGKFISCHDTRESATKQMRALYASEEKMSK
jgi:hypothetical protein